MSDEMGLDMIFGSVEEMTSRLESTTFFTRCGSICVPPFAIVAEIIAICSGVTRTSYWPMAAIAVCGVFMSEGKLDGVTRIGRRTTWPKPNFLACAASLSWPRSMPSSA